MNLPRRAAPLAALLSFAVPATAATPTPEGLWLWDTGDAAVEFHPCGAALCGRIVWVKEESAAGVAPLLDSRNPDKALRSRRVCGIDYITGLTRTAGGDWKKGRVYDYHGGASYDLDIDSVTAGGVTMRGYKGMRLFGATLKLVRPAAGATYACKPAA